MMFLRFGHVLGQAVRGIRDVGTSAIGDIAKFAEDLLISSRFFLCQGRCVELLVEWRHVVVWREGRVAIVHSGLLQDSVHRVGL